MNSVGFSDGAAVPALGQGTWRMGEGLRPASEEAAALRHGIGLGMTLIDTAEMYGDGAAERIVADAITGLRDAVFLVSKVYPHNASRRAMPKACEGSLARLRVDCIDLYLLHWPGSVPVDETIEAFERLREAGKIARWGVSNVDADGMAAYAGSAVAANQVLYNPGVRGIEFDLLPYCAATGIPVMAYSPVGQGGALLRDPAMALVATRHGATPAQVAIAWSLRQPGVISIPKASDLHHVAQNAAAADIVLTAQDLADIDAAFPPPQRSRPLAML